MSDFSALSESSFSEIGTKQDEKPPDSHIGISAFFGSLPLRQAGPNIEIISEIERCHSLWQEFAKPETLFDTWEFRYAFYLGYHFKPHFILFKNNQENLALLPLWYDEDKKRYEWFGSDWQEEVRIFSKDPQHIPALLSLAPTPLFLNAISSKSISLLNKNITFDSDDAKYVLHLEKFSNHEDYLATLKKNERHSMRKDRRRIENQKPEIIIDNFTDFDSLVEISKKRLTEKNKVPDWNDPRRIEAFRQVINLGGQSYKTRMITVKINGKIAGVDLICLLHDTYFTVKCGYNVAEFPGIGNFFNLIEIDDAIKLGFKKIDFLQNNCSWKSRWFEAVPLFKYQKN